MNPVPASPGEPNPALIWETVNAHQRTAALRAAVELNVFTTIGQGAHTADAIAARCSASQRGVRILCDYLTIVGLLAKENGRYQLTPTSAAFLDRRSPTCMDSIVNFINAPKLLEGFGALTEAVRRGGTALPQGGVTEAEFEEWVLFAKNMTPIVAATAHFAAEIATRDGAPRRVLDIAAGHGLFGISVAQREPQAEIVALDWPKVLEVAEENARAAGVAGRYRLLPGDALSIDWGTGYDVVLLPNFLHHFDEATCITLLKKTHASLEARGRVIIAEFVPNEDRITPPIPASFSMMMLGLTQNGDAYTKRQLDSMLQQAGFGPSELLQVPNSPEQLVVSRK